MSDELQSPMLSGIPGILHGFGTRANPVPAPLLEHWSRARPAWKQVHGTGSAEVRAPGERCGEVDALFSFKPLAPVGVVTADCVPVLLARRDGAAVAAIHAGWRGTRARILPALFRRLASEHGEEASHWVAAIGPSIGPCCYEVSEELAEEFASEFRSLGAGLAVPRQRYLDLPAINEAELRRLGIGEVQVLRACTRCGLTASGEPRFHSYRREGGGTRQYSIIVVTSGKRPEPQR